MSFEAVPHSPSCGVAQPQSSMKESHPAMLHLQEVAPTGTASSTSNKSTSLQLLLLLHATVGDAALRRRNEGPCSSRSHTATRAAGRRLRCARVTAALVSWWSPPAPAARRASGAFVGCRYFRPYPVADERTSVLRPESWIFFGTLLLVFVHFLTLLCTSQTF